MLSANRLSTTVTNSFLVKVKVMAWRHLAWLVDHRRYHELRAPCDRVYFGRISSSNLSCIHPELWPLQASILVGHLSLDRWPFVSGHFVIAGRTQSRQLNSKNCKQGLRIDSPCGHHGQGLHYDGCSHRRTSGVRTLSDMMPVITGGESSLADDAGNSNMVRGPSTGWVQE